MVRGAARRHTVAVAAPRRVASAAALRDGAARVPPGLGGPEVRPLVTTENSFESIRSRRVPASVVLGGLLAGLTLLSACGEREPSGRVEALPDPGLDFLAEPSRRRAGCLPVGETELTRPFLQPGATLVACRSGHGAGFALVAARGARQVARTPNYTLYSVPRGTAG